MLKSKNMEENGEGGSKSYHRKKGLNRISRQSQGYQDENKKTRKPKKTRLIHM